MPVLFIGHGSPYNGIQDNPFSLQWKIMAKEIPTPTAILVISAHWFTESTKITSMDFPKTIHDFEGFPKELYQVQYQAPGNPALASETASLIHSTQVVLDHDWGLDHGCWIIVKQMYPEAKIPVLQLSIDNTKDAKYHFDLAKELFSLRKKGILIIGSGNMVHNLDLLDYNHLHKPEYGYNWAVESNIKFKELILNNDFNALIGYQQLGKEAKMAIPTPEHYLPLLYSLALKTDKDELSFFNDRLVGGSVSMTSVKINPVL